MRRPVRILFLTDSLSDLDGVGRYAVCLIRALQRLRPGLEAEVLLARKHRPTSSQADPRWEVSVGLPPDYFFHMPRARFWTSLAQATWRVARAARRADLVHAIKDYPHSLAGALGARLAGVPCVATAHGTYSVQPLLVRRHARLARWTYRRLSALVCVSDHTRRRILESPGAASIDPGRVRVIPNAVSPPGERLPEGTRPWHAHPFTLSIGELKERKGHHLALPAWCAAAARRPAWHHYVVGRGSGDAYEAGLRAGLPGRVHLLGNVPEPDKDDLLRRARVFLHTPVTAADGGFEGFGIVYLEAAACGVPSIGTLGSGAEDAVEDGVTGLLVEPRVEAVQAALERLLDDEGLRRRMGEQARARAGASTWDDNARAVLAIYERALGPDGLTS